MSKLTIAGLSLLIGVGVAAVTMLLTALVDAWVRLLRRIAGRDRPRCRVCGLPVRGSDFCRDHEYLRRYLQRAGRPSSRTAVRPLEQLAPPQSPAPEGHDL